DQIGVFNDTLLKTTSLKVNAGDNNPIVRELEANLSSLKDALKRSVNNYYTSLLVKKKNIQDQHEKTREHIRNVSSRERDVNYIDREQRVRESLYVLLLNKREENSLALAATEDNARMVDDVRGGNGPLEPNVPKILMVGFLAGLAIPVVLCVVAAMLDSNVKRRKEIEALTAIPVYGELPRKLRKLKNQEIVVNLEEPSELSECFPLLAERMVALSDENAGKPLSVLITSTCSGEGKTYLSVNLALSLAVAGKKVLLMDMDLRKGSLSSLLGGAGKPGIGDLEQAGEGGWRSLVEQSPVSAHLDYLFAGTLPDHPSRLLLHDRIRKLMEELKEQYDFIFMDCVPYSSLADAHIVARLADVTLYVMRAGCVKKRDLAGLQKIWKNGELKRMGIVLCDVEPHGRSSRGYAVYRSLDTSSPCAEK
ncbi:GNVR domain-containing protein, partial [Akkermansia sp.]|uniref:nucleotide-binding protein n=1 Tax=Akkermansia sp. TaxID=1872421 RepID=UPI003AB63B20